MIGPTDIGKRVVVRRIAGERDGRTTYTDVLGTLLDFGDAATVQTSGGPVVVPVTEIAAAKPVPPRTTPTGADIAAVERAGSLAWPAAHTGRLGDWELRASGGWTGRANSVLPLGDPGVPLDAALAEIARWYAGFGLPARVNVPLPLRMDLDRALTERGWQRSPRTLVQARDLPGLAAAAGPAQAPVELSGEPDEPWLAMMAGMKGKLPEVARGILTGPGQVAFATIAHADGTPLAIARGAVTDGRLHLGLVQVRPEARRQGLAQRIVGALADWATGLGADRTYLQVEEANTAATALYARLGFTTHHSYYTWLAPQG